MIMNDDIVEVNGKATLKVQLVDEFGDPALMVPIFDIKLESNK